jgi:hypothetical protein
MKPVIILLNIDDFERKDANHLENLKVETEKELVSWIMGKNPEGEFAIYDLTDFMDLCNDQAFAEEQNWISYAFVKTEKN